MRLILDAEKHYDYLDDCVAAKPKTVAIASFGLYAGVLADGRDTHTWGPKYQSRTRDFLESLRSVPSVKILVGLGDFRSCRGPVNRCRDCERKYALDLMRHMNHREVFPEFSWRVSFQLHLKCALFTYPNSTVRGLAGGRNLTNSVWADVSVELDSPDLLVMAKHFAGVWTPAKTLTDTTLNGILAEQEIDESILRELIPDEVNHG